MQTLAETKKENSYIAPFYLEDINHKESDTKTHSRNGSLDDFLRVQNQAIVKPRVDSRGILNVGTLDSLLKPLGHAPASVITEKLILSKKNVLLVHLS